MYRISLQMTGLRLILGIGLALVPTSVFAYPTTITYTFQHHIFSVNASNNPQWRLTQRVWYFNGLAAVPPPRYLSCGQGEVIAPGWTFEDRTSWSEPAIAETLATEISAKLDRPAGSVVIRRDASGSILFDGYGLTGREVDLSQATRLTKTALEQGISLVILPVNITQPKIDIQDQGLKDTGIREVVTIGESVFAKSPVNRRHNIGIGVSRFNGVLIPRNGIFSFDQTLGPVNERTGYRKELVIQGETTLPDYGGGLCQVSTTAYRGPWEYGMPILQRKNHSYAVSYYSPQGTDATIFPPNTDLKFRNDTPGALLIQSFIDSSDQAYFIYYGTADRRRSEIFGPYITDRVSAPTDEKISYTTEIPVGEKRKAGERHDGMKAVWYRTVQYEGSGGVTQRIFSSYEARPLIYQVGVTPEDKARLTSGDLSSTPSWLPSKP